MPTATLLSNISEADIRKLSEEFENAAPREILRWANEQFGSDFALATGFGVEGCVLIAMLSEINREARFFYLDTGLLFPETYQLRERLQEKYAIVFERKTSVLTLEEQAEKYGDKLWERDPNLCCRLRKVEPLREMLNGLTVWGTAIRRDQSPARANAGIVERDEKFGLIKINPLARWTKRDVWKYVMKHDVPYNPLHDENYSSIGCLPCTTPVRIGEDDRSGRWRGIAKTECGLHG